VGVLEDIALGGGPLERTDRVYLSLSQRPSSEVLLLVRTGRDPGEVMRAVRRVVAQVDPSVPVWSVRTLADAHAYLIRVPRDMGAMALGGGWPASWWRRWGCTASWHSG